MRKSGGFFYFFYCFFSVKRARAISVENAMLITVNHRNPLRSDKTWTFHVLEGQHPSRRAAEAWRGHHDVQRHHQAQNQVGNGNPVLILHKHMNQSSFVPFIYLIHVAFERLSWKTPIETELERTDKGFSEDCAT